MGPNVRHVHGGRILLVAAVLTVALVGCGEESPSTLGAPSVTTTVPSLTAGYGSPGTASSADRTIAVNIVTPLAYQPSSIEVQPGETVVFAVTNHTSGLHQFVIGNANVENAYEAHMVQMGSSPMEMPDETNVVDLEAGQTKQLAWTFPMTGTVIFGSHQPGDYGGGLKGTITVGGSAPLSTTTVVAPPGHSM